MDLFMPLTQNNDLFLYTITLLELVFLRYGRVFQKYTLTLHVIVLFLQLHDIFCGR